MAPSTVRALLPTVSTVLVIAAGALAARVLHAGTPPALVVTAALGAVVVTALAVLAVRRPAATAPQHRTRRRDELDAEWAAVEPAWRSGSGYPER